MSAFKSHMRQNAYYRNLKWMFEDLFPCYYYTIKTNSKITSNDFILPSSVPLRFVAVLLLQDKYQQENNPLSSFATYLCVQRSGYEWTTSSAVSTAWHYNSEPGSCAVCYRQVLPEQWILVYCCDRKSRAEYAQSFALWEQATIEFTCHDHSIIACSRHIHVWCCSSRTSRLWWITQSTQHHRRGSNNIPFFSQRTAPIAHSLCEGGTPHDIHILATAPFCCDQQYRAEYAQRFATWQQATIEFTCHDHSIIACSSHIHVLCCSSRTSRSWWITQSTQHHRRVSNNIKQTLRESQ